MAENRAIRVGIYKVIANLAALLCGLLLVFSAPSRAEDALGNLIDKITKEEGAKAPGVTDERYMRLMRGVNFFVQMDNDDLNAFTEDDVKRLKEMGVTHVSIASSPAPLWKDGRFDEKTWAQPAGQKLLNKIHKMTAMLMDADLAVVLKVMPSEDDYRALYFSPDETLPRWVAFYAKWAKEFSSYPADKLFFHTPNEPRFMLFMAEEQKAKDDSDGRFPKPLVDGATRMWASLEDKLVDTIRTQTFAHTILVSGDAFAGIDGMQAHPLFSDANIVYNFHYYLPLVFTHQSATWVDLPGSKINNLSYPSDSKNCSEKTALSASNPYLIRYCSGAWNKDRHQKEIGAMAEWAKKNNVRVWLGEFGAYPDKAEAESIQNYYRDIREIAETNGIGWSAWEYANWLKRLNDDKMQSALGLTVKPQTAK